MAAIQRVAVIEDPERASVALHPIRRQILRRLEKPTSPAALSKTLGIPRQHLNYHFRELESAGLVELIEEKRRGSVVERFYQARAQSYVISPRALGELSSDPDAMPSRFSPEYLIAVGSRLIEEVASLDQDQPTYTLETTISFASDADRSAFARELTAAISRLATTYHKEEGTPHRIVIGAHQIVGE